MANVYPFRTGPRFKFHTTSLKQPVDYATPIIIDNGSFECRAGFANYKQPSMRFKSVVSKQRKKDSDVDVTLVGNDIENMEALRNLLKSPFDKNVVTQYEAQEQVLDHIFSHLCVTEDSVPYPIVMTEPVCNPNRRYMSELLFECYRVPRVAYGVDGLFSFYGNQSNLESATGIVVSFGYEVTHIIPVVDGKMDVANVRRINMGGYHLDYMMQKLLQLKYPIHSSSIHLSRCEEIVQEHCFVAEDYTDALTSWLDVDYYEKNVHKMQLPCTSTASSTVAAAAMAGERQAERSRLLNEKVRLEKIADKQSVLDQLIAIRSLTGAALHRRLGDLGLDSLNELTCHVNAMRTSLEDLKAKLAFKDEFAAGRLTAESVQQRIEELDSLQTAQSAIAPSLADVAEYYQLHVAIERVRVPELLFQPSMLGLGQGGIGETLAFVLGKYDADLQKRLTARVLLTGGCAALPGICKRITHELRALRPFHSDFNVVVTSGEPALAAWRGARAWVLGGGVEQCAVDRACYEECGGDYLKESGVSNRGVSSVTNGGHG